MAFKFNAKVAREYQAMWDGLSISPNRRNEVHVWAHKIFANKARYQTIEARTGVPWHFVGLAHYRESSLNFNKNLANGQPLNMRTTIVPKGRGPYRDFEESAVDSLVNVQGYHRGMDWSLPAYIWRIEGYNGYGYHAKGIPSPYLVGGSNKQKRGKYVADGVYSPSTWDTQLGVLTLLQALVEIDPSISFGHSAPASRPAAIPDDPAPAPTAPDPEQEAPTPSPEADGDTKPAIKSKTIWASLTGILTAVIGAVTDWRVLLVLVIAIFLFIIADRYLKLDIKGWFRS